MCVLVLPNDAQRAFLNLSSTAEKTSRPSCKFRKIGFDEIATPTKN